MLKNEFPHSHPVSGRRESQEPQDRGLVRVAHSQATAREQPLDTGFMKAKDSAW